MMRYIYKQTDLLSKPKLLMQNWWSQILQTCVEYKNFVIGTKTIYALISLSKNYAKYNGRQSYSKYELEGHGRRSIGHLRMISSWGADRGWCCFWTFLSCSWSWKSRPNVSGSDLSSLLQISWCAITLKCNENQILKTEKEEHIWHFLILIGMNETFFL